MRKGRTKGTEFYEKNFSPTVKHGGGSVMLCGCIAGTGNISQLEERMDSIKFQRILEANITPSVKKKNGFYKWITIQNKPQNPRWTT